MNISRLFIALFLLFAAGIASAQTWSLELPHPLAFETVFVEVAPDGGLVVAESRESDDSTTVTRISPAGGIVWQKQIAWGGTSPASPQIVGCAGIYFEPNGDMILILNRKKTIGQSFALVRLTSDGTEISRIIKSGISWAQASLREPNGDFIVTRALGYAFARLAPDGTTIWQSTNNVGGQVNFTNTIVKADNGDYLSAVNGFYQNGNGMIVIRADANGTALNIYNWPKGAQTYNIAKGPDGNFLVAGSTDSITWQVMTLFGEVLKQVTHDDSLPLTVYDAVALSDGYVLAGKKGTEAAIWRLDLNGNLVFEQTFLPGMGAQFTSLSVHPGTQLVSGAGRLTTTVNGGSDAFVLQFDASLPATYGLVGGTVRLDPEQDCEADDGEQALKNLTLLATSATDTFFATTNASGNFKFVLDSGTYDIQVIDNQPYLDNCMAAQSLTLDGGDSLSANFWMQKMFDCPLMQVSISTPRLRRCFSNYYAVRYANVGTATALDSRIEVVLDPHLDVIATSIPLSGTSGDTLFFELGDVPPDTDVQFTIEVEIEDCPNVAIGQTLCSSAHIFPGTICGDFSNWLGASMAVGGLCDGDSVRMFVTNKGIAPSSQVLDYIVTEDNVILMIAGDQFDPGDTTWVVYAANGATWRIKSEQEPGHPGASKPTFVLEACTANGNFSTGFLAMFPMDDGDFAHDEECNEVVASYDPNEKKAFPLGYGSQRFIERGTDIEYTLGFQNTGNDTAFTVVLRDTLPTTLDPASIEIGAASHPFSWALEGHGVLVFRFENILLPDSNTNELASHGWARFRIAQKPNLLLGTRIENRAGIYFDFNDPVITNYTLHTIGANFVEIVSVEGDELAKEGLRVYPNPVAAGNWLVFEKMTLDGLVFRLFGISGTEIFSDRISNGRVLLPGNLGAGTVVFRLENTSGTVVGSGKLMVGVR